MHHDKPDQGTGNHSPFKTILKANNYDVMVTASGAEALTIISSHCPDLVILDLGLPDMDGTELLKSLREWSSIPVIVLSAREATENAKLKERMCRK